MRVIVFFDLPTETLEDKREYRKFHKVLIKNGFLMMQESVYSKIALNAGVAASVCEEVRRAKPPKGLVQMLTVTEKQYSQMETVVGKVSSTVLSSDERLVVL